MATNSRISCIGIGRLYETCGPGLVFSEGALAEQLTSLFEEAFAHFAMVRCENDRYVVVKVGEVWHFHAVVKKHRDFAVALATTDKQFPTHSAVECLDGLCNYIEPRYGSTPLDSMLFFTDSAVRDKCNRLIHPVSRPEIHLGKAARDDSLCTGAAKRAALIASIRDHHQLVEYGTGARDVEAGGGAAVGYIPVGCNIRLRLCSCVILSTVATALVYVAGHAMKSQVSLGTAPM